MATERIVAAPREPTIDEAFAYCRARVKAHYENFPVGLFVPREKRRYVYALYAFARAADDFADEPECEGTRRERLAEWQARLDETYEGRPEGPIFVGLGETIRRLDIPKSLLDDLLSAFRQDTVKQRYASWEELLDYCERSANPIGRLVLLVFGYKDPSFVPLSDAICTALQLANHWQDLGIDAARDRLYVPADAMARHGVSDTHLRERRADTRFKGLMAELVERTRRMFEVGRPLCDRVGKDVRFELRLTWLGGTAILDRIESAGYDVFRKRPRHSRAAKLALALQAWKWKPA